MANRFAEQAPVAVACLVAAASTEVFRMIMRVPFGGYDPTFLDIYGATLVVLWGATAFALFARKSWAWPLSVIAAPMLFVHGAVLRLGDAPVGLLYLLEGVLASVSVLLQVTGYGVPAPRPRRHGRPSLRPSLA